MLKCPKCRKTVIRIAEHIVCPEEMYQTKSGVVTFFTGVEGGMCYVIKWVGECLSCGRRWRIRKRLEPSITLPNYMNGKQRMKWLEEN